MKSDSAITIGKKVKALRMEADMSQIEFATATGLSRRTIINIESGSFDTGTNELRMIARACRKKLEIVFT